MGRQARWHSGASSDRDLGQASSWLWHWVNQGHNNEDRLCSQAFFAGFWQCFAKTLAACMFLFDGLLKPICTLPKPGGRASYLYLSMMQNIRWFFFLDQRRQLFAFLIWCPDKQFGVVSGASYTEFECTSPCSLIIVSLPNEFVSFSSVVRPKEEECMQRREVRCLKTKLVGRRKRRTGCERPSCWF